MSESADPTHALEDDVNWLLNRVWLGFGEARSTALAPLGLTVREHVLMTVLATTDATQLELAGIIRMDKSVLTTTIDGLENRGLVRRQADPRDRRAKRPELTAAGKRLCARADVASREVQERLLERVPASIRAEFVEALRDLTFGPFATTLSFS